jgi:hypothetical protein
MHRQIGEAAHARPESSEQPMGAQSGSAELTMAQGRSSIETYYVSTLERPELPTKTAEPWWPLRFADVMSSSITPRKAVKHREADTVKKTRFFEAYNL